MADEEQKTDAAFDIIVKNAQVLIDSHLPAMPQIANDEGQNPKTSGAKNRVENLLALREEIEITQKLAIYFREMVTRLLFEEREEDQLKPDKYSRELRLPLDTITRIISFVPSNNLLTGSSRSCLEARIIGVPFIAIFHTSLLQHHFDKEYDPNWTLADIANQEIKWSILEEKQAVRHMRFDVWIHIYAPTRPGRDQTMIYSLLQFSKHWRVLKIQLKSIRSISTVLRLCMPCIPYLDYLDATGYATDGLNLQSSDLIPDSQILVNVPIRTNNSLKLLRVSFNMLEAFFDVGLCEYVTELAPAALSGCRFSDEESKFRHVLSNMPSLRKLHVPQLPDSVPDNLPPIKSEGLCHLTVICSSTHTFFYHRTVASFLKLFVECPINCLELWNPPKPTLKCVSELFPGLKHLIYHNGQKLEMLFVPGQDGNLRFPKLEHLTLVEYKSGDEDELRQQIIEIARIRTCTPEIVPLKMISVHENYSTDSLVEELRRYVPFVEKNKGPSKSLSHGISCF